MSPKVWSEKNRTASQCSRTTHEHHHNILKVHHQTTTTIRFIQYETQLNPRDCCAGGSLEVLSQRFRRGNDANKLPRHHTTHGTHIVGLVVMSWRESVRVWDVWRSAEDSSPSFWRIAIKVRGSRRDRYNWRIIYWELRCLFHTHTYLINMFICICAYMFIVIYMCRVRQWLEALVWEIQFKSYLV